MAAGSLFDGTPKQTTQYFRGASRFVVSGPVDQHPAQVVLLMGRGVDPRR